MVANKYAFLQITRRRFLNEWEAFKKVISRRNIRRRITIPPTLSNLKLLRRITRTENILRSEERFSRNAETDIVCRLLLEKKNDSGFSSLSIMPTARAGTGVTFSISTTRAA